jgi:uncharacterized protein (TIGR02996 family)
MSTEAALLRTIRDTPDDDTARLVYADFVEEEGDAARGEFIRVQVALARLPDDDPRRAALEDREHELLAENEDRWLDLPADADGLAEWEFERGFVNEVAATPWFMLGPGADLCAAHPVRRWRVQSAQDNMADDLIECGRNGWFARLEAVDLAGWYQSIGELERFLTRSDFEQLRELDLTDRPGLEHLPAILERAPFREQLKVLRCGGRHHGEAGRVDAWNLTRALAPARLAELAAPGCMLTAQDVRGLLVSDCCRELTSLDVGDNPVEPDGWDAFRFAAFRYAPCRLRELDLSGTPLGGISLDDVLRQDSLAELRALHLNRCGSAMANVRALAASRFWTQAEELRMQQGTVPERALESLFTSPGPPNLRVLDVAGNYFRDDGVRGLCNARWADALTYLDLSSNYLTDEALHLLASCGRFTHLRTLHLSGNNRSLVDADPHEILTDVGARALSESASLANLRFLGMTGTDVTAAGIEALLDSPHWCLTRLGLGGCYARPEVARVLARSPRLARLSWLDLSNNVGLREDALIPLAKSEYLSPRCELDIRGCYPNPETRDALRQRLGRRLSE